MKAANRRPAGLDQMNAELDNYVSPWKGMKPRHKSIRPQPQRRPGVGHLRKTSTPRPRRALDLENRGGLAGARLGQAGGAPGGGVKRWVCDVVGGVSYVAAAEVGFRAGLCADSIWVE